MLVSLGPIGKRSVLALFTLTLVIALILIILGKGGSVDVESRPIASATPLDVPAPVADFSVNANPTSVTVNASTPGTSTITVTGLATGTVSLTTNSTWCTVTPNTVTGPGSSRLSCNFATGQLVHVNVTGTNFLTQHSTIVTYTVQDFAIGASAPSPVNLGIPASSAITVSGQNGFAGTIILRASPSTNALTCAFNPLSVTLGGPQPSNLSCSSTMAGSFVVIITGNAGQLSHTTSVMMIFGDFSITADPSPVTLQAGSSANSTIALTNNGYNGKVTLSILSNSQPAPNGLTAMLNPPVLDLQPGVSQSSVLTVTSTSATPAGNYSITITSSSTTPHSIPVNIIVQGNFTMALTNSQLVVVEGGFAKTNMTLTSLGFSGTILFSSQPPKNSTGLRAGFNPLLIRMVPGSVNTTIVSIITSTNTIPGTYNMTLTGTGNGIQHSIYLKVTVSDFSILIEPNPISLPPNSQGNENVTLRGLLQFNGTITLKISPIIGFTLQLSASNVTLGSTNMNATVTLTIQVTSNISPRVYTVTITGTIGGLRHEVILKVSVVEFTINAPSIINLPRGQSGSFPVTITSQNSFTGIIDLNSTVAPNIGLTAVFTPDSISLLPNQTAPLLLTLTSNTSGFYFLTINGTSGHSSSYQYIQVYIGEFSISAGASSVVIAPGTSRSLMLTVTSEHSFSGTINLNGISTPTGIRVSLSSEAAVLRPGGTVSVTVTLSALQVSPGTFNVTILAGSGQLSHAIYLRVIVVSPPSLIVPNVKTVDPGTILTFTVTATDEDPYVTISTSGLPTGASFITSYRTGSTITIVTGIFNWKPAAGQAPGDYVITFTAQDRNGGVTTQRVTVHVNGSIDRSIPLPSPIIFLYGIIVAAGVVATLVGSRVLKNRKIRALATREHSLTSFRCGR